MFFTNSVKIGKEVIEDLFFFPESQMLDCNQYLINNRENDEIILFDAGNGKSLKALFEGMNNIGLDYKKITKVYITHEHVDHVLGLYELLDVMKNNPPEIFAYEKTAKILQEGNESEIIPRDLGISSSMLGIEIRPIKVVNIKENDQFRLNSEFTFKIFYTPGHSLGSIIYYEINKKILIPGDLVFAGGSFGRYDFPGGSLTKLQDSIEFTNKLDVEYLLPGHMNISDNGNEQIEYSNKMVHSIRDYF
ncbi:MAG: MBL fold metallo-hydrolase [Candidatus Lokiarchaeota archaeon]|nr:MBL fold metallo-hydrolase [Candidatus Lokiarchaeota archaeon]